MTTRPSPIACWYLANDEHPGNAEARQRRYMELLREHGHVVAGTPEPLPCGWTPGHRFRLDAEKP